MTVATGKQEYGGRVRGVGRDVGIRYYFGVSQRRSPHVIPRAELESLLSTIRTEAKEEVRAQAEASIEAQLQEGFAKMKEEMLSIMTSRQQEPTDPLPPSTAARPSTKGSCCLPLSEDAEHCDLYVEDPLRHLVARGSIHSLGATVHHIQIQDDQLRVTVEDVLIGDALVPMPTDEVKTVSQAKGTFILWPKHLVLNHVTSSPSQLPTPPTLNAMQRVIFLAYDKTSHVDALPMDSAVGDMGAPAFLDHADVKSLITPKEELTSGFIQVFFMYVYNLNVNICNNKVQVLQLMSCMHCL